MLVYSFFSIDRATNLEEEKSVTIEYVYSYEKFT